MPQRMLEGNRVKYFYNTQSQKSWVLSAALPKKLAHACLGVGELLSWKLYDKAKS